VVENPKFAVGIVILSVIVPELSVIVAITPSLGYTLFGLAMVENRGLAVGISTPSVVVPVV